MTDGRILNPDVLGFMAALLDAENATTEGPVQNLWTSALTLLFPQAPTAASPNVAYRLSIEEARLATNHEVATAITVMELRMATALAQPRDPADLQSRQIFIVECKDAGSDTPSEWQEAEVHLAQHLEQTFHGSGVGRLYAAIGVGTKIVFYEWDQLEGPDHKNQMTPMHLGPLDFGTPAHRRTIEEYFEQIRNDGWDRSLS